MTVEFLICTYGDRISQAAEVVMAPQADVSYLISWQSPMGDEAIPLSLRNRSDVCICRLEGLGLSRNRNHALFHATGDILVIADDDCRYTPMSVTHVREAFSRHPDAAIVQLRVQTREMPSRYCRAYSTVPYEYARRPRFTYYSSCELALRRSAALPRFDERFGIGAPLACGEEEIFVFETHRRGLQIWFEPLDLARTSAGSTGRQFAERADVQRAKGGMLTLIHGPLSAWLRCLKVALTFPQVTITQRFSFMTHMIQGIIYVITHHSHL